MGRPIHTSYASDGPSILPIPNAATRSDNPGRVLLLAGQRPDCADFVGAEGGAIGTVDIVEP